MEEKKERTAETKKAAKIRLLMTTIPIELAAFIFVFAIPVIVLGYNSAIMAIPLVAICVITGTYLVYSLKKIERSRGPAGLPDTVQRLAGLTASQEGTTLRPKKAGQRFCLRG